MRGGHRSCWLRCMMASEITQFDTTVNPLSDYLKHAPIFPSSFSLSRAYLAATTHKHVSKCASIATVECPCAIPTFWVHASEFFLTRSRKLAPRSPDSERKADRWSHR